MSQTIGFGQREDPVSVFSEGLTVGQVIQGDVGGALLSGRRTPGSDQHFGLQICSRSALYMLCQERRMAGMRHRTGALALLGWLGLTGGASLAGVAAPAAPASAAPYIVKVWHTEHGLPQHSILALAQTKDGYLWLGTIKGLVRFDGLRFTVFDQSNAPELNSSEVVALFADSRGDLWIGTSGGGIAVLRDGQLSSTGIGRYNPERRLAAACEDASGAVWLYTANGELWRYAEGRFTPYAHGEGGSSECRAIIAEVGGPVWVGTDWHLASISSTQPQGLLEPRFDQNIALNQKLDLLLASSAGGHWRLAGGRIDYWRSNRLERSLGEYPWGTARVTAACEDAAGGLVVGTLGQGLFLFNGEGRISRLSTENELSYNYILSLLADREGNLWVGTDGGGLNRVKRAQFEVLEPVRGMVVQSAAEDSGGGLWIGFNTIGTNAQGAALWKSGSLRWFGLAQGLMNASVRSVFVDGEENVWAGTLGGLFRFQNDRFYRVLGPPILAMHQDRKGQLWMGTQAGLLRRDGQSWTTLGTRQGLSAEVVRAIADDAEGRVWVGTKGGGLNVLENGRFRAFRKEEGFPSDDIASLHVDAEGVLWIGTDDAGLVRMHQGTWHSYAAPEGLTGNSAGYLIEDNQGHLWLGTYAGLTRVPKRALSDYAQGITNFIPWRTYGRVDGLPTSECTFGSQPGACRARDGRLWFPTIQGLASVRPETLRLNTKPPPVVIEAVLVDGQPQKTNPLNTRWSGGITVPAGRERIEIQYTSLNFSAPDRARFRYRLAHHETDWTEAGNSRVVRYSKLPPRQYVFEVTACNEDGVWNEVGSTLAIVVQPPFWRTWWFLTAATIGLLGMVAGTVHRISTQRLQRQVARLKEQESLERERSRIARDLHDQLGASLTQVALLGEMVESDKDAPQEVETHAQQICQTARETTRVLDEIVWAVNPSNDTLEGLVNYVCKYAQEYLAVAGVRYRLEVPPQLPAAAIAPDVRHNVFLAAKEAITNIVRHAKATEARLRLQLDEQSFALEIEDNGCGLALSEQAASRHGLGNMRQRMQDVGGQFVIGPAKEGGTLVRLIAPLERAGPKTV